MNVQSLRTLPKNMQRAVESLRTQNSEEAVSLPADQVETIAVTEFGHTQSRVQQWDNVKGLDSDERAGSVEVGFHPKTWVGAASGDSATGSSSSWATSETGGGAMHVEFTPESVDVYRLNLDDDGVTGSRMHADRTTGEAYLTRY